MGEKSPSRKKVIAIATVLSLVLYLAGVLSGLYANTILKKETKKDIQSLKEETKQDLDSMQDYITFLDQNLRNMQLEQTFMETLSRKQMCEFSMISLNQLFNQLGYYWEKLPFRLEEYELNNPELPEEYVKLKQEYAHLSVRIWILAKSQYSKCNMDVVHGLHFYSSDCPLCVEQGKEIEKLGKMLSKEGKDLIIFPVDLNLDESIIKNLRVYYKIDSTPAIILNEKVYQGKLFRAEDLMSYENQ